MTQMNLHSSCEEYDVKHDEWSAFPNMNMGREHFGLVEFRGTLYAFGGDDRSREKDDTIEKFDENQGKWLVTPLRLSRPRGNFVAVVVE